MQIPAFLRAAYSADPKLEAFASFAVGRIDAHISASRMVFFPEYTDHSVRHIELTLQTALDLVTPLARGLLTPLDAATLVVGISLHDLGMHLTKNGFESLVAANSKWKGSDFFDQRKTWSDLWEEFYAEATRFDGRKLNQLFGNDYRPVRPLPKAGATWEDFDYLLVGEFLRRHHPRLAHDTALFGLPAKDGASVDICLTSTDDYKFLADISGLLGRSHGIDLRSCIDYLQQKYKNRVEPRGSHPIFAGALLRIADYFQIQASRAPTARTEVDTFQSKLSTREWTVHQSVKDISNTDDPEAIVVIAEPKDVDTFLKLKNWLVGLQAELDKSWAILGEVYGLQNHNNLNHLGLKIRRVKSNIDDVEEFAKTVDYVPAKITFEAANADLLKLLVGPLYGDNHPGVGLRELFQNSVDAVREFDDLALQYPKLSKIERMKQKSDVALIVDCDKDGHPTQITITDRGVGMTPETIRDYFLKAGASFRRSNIWQKEHEDEEGHSRVLRTGRFGVGVLAAFLLGDEIEVTTRHAFSTQGVTFTAHLDDEAISLRQIQCAVGTQIRIKVPEHRRETVSRIVPSRWKDEIEYDDEVGQYFLKYPSLSRHFINAKNLPLAPFLPQPDDNVSPDWRKFSNSQFQAVFWTYEDKYPSLASNGIIIDGSTYGHDDLGFFFERPRLSVFDRDGLLPINLQRTELIGELPFHDDLLRSIADDLVAHAIDEGPCTAEGPWFRSSYEGFSDDNSYAYVNWARWLIGRDGFVLNERNLVAEFAPKAILVAFGGPTDLTPWVERLRSALPSDFLIAAAEPNAFSENSPRIKGFLQRLIRGWYAPPHGERVPGFALFVPEVLLKRARELRPGKRMKIDLGALALGARKRGWMCLTSDEPVTPALDIPRLVSVDERNPIALAILKFKLEDDPDDDTANLLLPLKERWMDLCGTSLVPFDRTQRILLRRHAAKPIKKIFEARRAALARKKAKDGGGEEED